MPETAQRTRTSQSTFGVNVMSFSPWVSVWDTESYPYIASIVSASPAPRVSALPRPDAQYLA